MSHRILIVDDEETTHEILGLYLQRAGFEVVHARDGASGLAEAERCAPALVLLDLQMPGMDGFQVLEAMRRRPSLQRTPVLLVTSHGQQHLKVKGLELGADDYIVKPFQRAEVLARVRAALRRAEQARPRRGSLEGDLADLGPGELIQTFGLGGRAARIELVDVGGVLALRAGRLLEAALGEHRGEAALERILWLARGTYVVTLDPEALLELDEETVQAAPGVQGVLMRLQAGLDETQRQIEGRIALTDAVSVELARAPAAVDRLLPEVLTVAEWILRAPGSVADAVASLVAGLEDGWIQRASRATAPQDQSGSAPAPAPKEAE